MEERGERISFLCIFLLAAAISVSIPVNFLSGSAELDTAIVGPEEATLPVDATAAVIPCKGMIDDGLYQSIIRRTDEAAGRGATFLIYEIQTYGGVLKSADDISKYFILDVGKKYHTVAYITTEAISAGSMISVACKDIIMLENTTIGDCAPIIMGGTLEGVEREKAESFTRAAFMRAAEANGYPAALLKAMVSRQLEVYRVKNFETEEYEFFETKDIPKDNEKYDIENKELIVKDDELLTLTASQAQEYGIARTQVRNLNGVLEYLSSEHNVTFNEKPFILHTNWSEEMVRWVNSPVVMAVLVMLAMLGVYIELSTPGLGLPGLVAVICIVIIVGSKYLVGLANWLEVAILIIGIILLAIEIFVIPGFGLTGLTGILFIFAGLFGMLIKNAPDQIPWPADEAGWKAFSEGILSLLSGFAGFLIFAYLFAKYIPKLQFMGGLVLNPPAPDDLQKVKVAASGTKEARQVTITEGDTGEVVSPLRPSGWAKFGEQVVNVVTEAQFLEVADIVEVVEVEGNRVVVKKVEN